MEAVKKAGTRGKKESEKRYVVVSRLALTYFKQEQRENNAFLFLRMNSARMDPRARVPTRKRFLKYVRFLCVAIGLRVFLAPSRKVG